MWYGWKCRSSFVVRLKDELHNPAQAKLVGNWYHKPSPKGFTWHFQAMEVSDGLPEKSIRGYGETIKIFILYVIWSYLPSVWGFPFGDTVSIVFVWSLGMWDKEQETSRQSTWRQITDPYVRFWKSQRAMKLTPQSAIWILAKQLPYFEDFLSTNNYVSCEQSASCELS